MKKINQKGGSAAVIIILIVIVIATLIFVVLNPDILDSSSKDPIQCEIDSTEYDNEVQKEKTKRDTQIAKIQKTISAKEAHQTQLDSVIRTLESTKTTLNSYITNLNSDITNLQGDTQTEETKLEEIRNIIRNIGYQLSEDLDLEQNVVDFPLDKFTFSVAFQWEKLNYHNRISDEKSGLWGQELKDYIRDINIIGIKFAVTNSDGEYKSIYTNDTTIINKFKNGTTINYDVGDSAEFRNKWSFCHTGEAYHTGDMVDSNACVGDTECDEESCRHKCYQNSECKFWDFEIEGDTPKCRLRSNDGDGIEDDPDAFGGMRSCIDDNTIKNSLNYWGDVSSDFFIFHGSNNQNGLHLTWNGLAGSWGANWGDNIEIWIERSDS